MSVEEILLKMLLFTLRIADVGTFFFVTLVEIESFVHYVHIYQERQNLRVQGFPPSLPLISLEEIWNHQCCGKHVCLLHALW